ncbi:GGDEF domain-containing protein [Neptunicella sp. SCSIO 80796]|uniref:GGDEF domain-containing protein n=1 Tax=Neptunicella plasticusilytica TaxID=3117012 RepID=UPI003A4E201A
MISFNHLASVLDALPDPCFILSRSGKYVAVFGGKDSRYYHDGSGLVGLKISDLIRADKADWFLQKIDAALQSRKLLIEEYELSNSDVKGLPDEGPDKPIWFEGRIQALDFLVEDEEVVLWVASNISERHELESRLRTLSDTDQLTNLYNRRRMERDLTLQYQSFVRHSTETSVLMLDLDNLKQINDTLGHHVGDKVILAIADICRSQLRQTDIACRFGGDEFVIALPNIEIEHAGQFAARLCECIKMELASFSEDGIEATVSIGVTTFVPQDQSYEDALKRVDNALYQAKRKGKNTVVCA